MFPRKHGYWDIHCTVPEDGESFVLVCLCSGNFHISTLLSISIFCIILLFNLLPPFVKYWHKSAWTCSLKTQYLKFQHVIIVQFYIDCLFTIVCQTYNMVYWCECCHQQLCFVFKIFEHYTVNNHASIAKYILCWIVFKDLC